VAVCRPQLGLKPSVNDICRLCNTVSHIVLKMVCEFSVTPLIVTGGKFKNCPRRTAVQKTVFFGARYRLALHYGKAFLACAAALTSLAYVPARREVAASGICRQATLRA
jgi:hypothetical protein